MERHKNIPPMAVRRLPPSRRPPSTLCPRWSQSEGVLLQPVGVFELHQYSNLCQLISLASRDRYSLKWGAFWSDAMVVPGSLRRLLTYSEQLSVNIIICAQVLVARSHTHTYAQPTGKREDRLFSSMKDAVIMIPRHFLQLYSHTGIYDGDQAERKRVHQLPLDMTSFDRCQISDATQPHTGCDLIVFAHLSWSIWYGF